MEICLNNLTYTMGKKRILDNIQFTLQKGTYGILGPNGAGKTTLLRCLCGIYRPEKGMLSFSGEMSVGYLPQNFGMHGNLTAYENLEYFYMLKGLPKEEMKGQISTCLEQVNLTEERELKVKKMSGGMVRRLGIAQAMLGNPNVVILDEPTVGLDPQERSNIKRVFQEIGKNSIFIMSTHIVEDIEKLCEHIIVMKDGKIIKLEKTISGMGSLEDAYLCMLKDF